MKTLREKFFRSPSAKDCPIYDMHGHMGPFYGAHFPIPDADSMVRRMRRAGVKLLAYCHHASLFGRGDGNRANIEAARKYPKELKAYCGVNPNYPDEIAKMLDSYDRYRDAFIGFKMLADYHGIAITDAKFAPVWEFADANGLIVLIHTWGNSPFDGQDQVKAIAEKYHNVKINIGHSCHGEWDKAVGLVKSFPNLYLDLCAVLDDRGILEKFVEEAGADRILFGTDFPWFDYHWCVGAVLGADISDGDRRRIFYGNARKLLGPAIP